MQGDDRLSSLNDKLLLLILSLLDEKSICRVEECSHRLWRAASQDALWRRLHEQNFARSPQSQIRVDNNSATRLDVEVRLFGMRD
jgi:hypothetical protein